MAGSFSSIKKSKKISNNAKLTKQPQRGLGVAQLEKIRMQRQIAEFIDPSMQSPFLGNYSQQGIHVEALPFSYSSVMPQASGFVHNPNITMAYRCSERPEARYEDCVHWLSTSSSSSHNNIISHRCEQDSVTLPLFEQNVQDSENYMRRQQHEWIHVIDLTTPNNEEIDLELRL